MIEKVNSLTSFSGNTPKIDKQNVPSKNDKKPNQVVIISQEGAKALRNLALGTLAVLGSSTMVVGCDDDPDFKFVHESNTDVEVNIHDCPVKPDTIHVNDTITVVLPGDTVKIKDKYSSEVADSLIAHGKNLGFKFDGQGSIPVRINAFDQWNSTNHDMIMDGDASSKEKMVFIDEAKDYSKDSKNPEVRYNRVEFSVDRLRGVGTEIKKAPYVGVKPTSALEWRDAAKICLTNNQNGFSTISEYDTNNVLIPIGNLEKSKESDVDFYENLYRKDSDDDTFSWSEAKMTLASPEK